MVSTRYELESGQEKTKKRLLWLICFELRERFRPSRMVLVVNFLEFFILFSLVAAIFDLVYDVVAIFPLYLV